MAKFSSFLTKPLGQRSSPRTLRNQRGQSLMQVMISVAIMGIIMMAMTSLQSSQSRENRALAEKLAANDLTRTISSTFVQAASCNLLFTKANNVINSSALTFNPAGGFPFSIYLNSVPQSSSVDIISITNPVASVLSSTLKIKSTNGIEVKVTGPTTANLLIHFDQSGLTRAINDLSFKISLATVPVAGNAQIVGCGAGGGTCAANETVTGINPDGTPICQAASGSSPSGTICGFYTGSVGINCQGFNPATNCPSGYTQQIVQTGVNPSTSMYNPATPIMAYFCVHN